MGSRSPLVAEGKADFKGSASAEKNQSSTSKYSLVSLDDIVREIGGSDFVVFVDDFHYIDREVRTEIGKQIKAAAEKGVRICTASVPHRSDDVVRSNPELRGRVTAIDMTYWDNAELEEIAKRGFAQLNVRLPNTLIQALSAEAFGSPQLMQTICLNFCFEQAIRQAGSQEREIDIDTATLRQTFERTTATTDFSTMLTALHAGPKQRGTERKQFEFVDGTSGDVYRCVLLAMKADPSALSFRYDEMLKRTQQVCKGDSPVGSSVSQSLVQMAEIAQMVQEAPVIEWDDDVLDIVEPYFLFFIRSSPHLARLGRKSDAQVKLAV